jgi:hypothetical protein
MLVFSGVMMLALIALPLVFRELDPFTRANIVEYVPIMGTFQPTRVYNKPTLPTAQPATVSADLLATPIGVAVVPSPTLEPTISASPTPLLPTAPSMISLLATITMTPENGVELPTVTPFPTPTSLPTAVPTPLPTPTDPPVPVSYRLNGIKRVFQKWNDCGPANLTQALQYYGWSGTEDDARLAIKPTNDDRNVSPYELVEFVRNKTGVKAIARVGGNLTLLKRLISSNFVVIIEKGYDLPDGWSGHYLTLLGYDDARGIIYGGDTNLGFGPDGLGLPEKYEDIDTRWQSFNRTYIVVFPADRETELAGILGPDADPSQNLKRAADLAQRELNQKRDNAFVWFNLGSTLTQLGDYKRATVAFDQARNTGTQLPWRMLWYQFAPFEAYYRMGNFQEVKALADVTLANAPIEEARYWRALATAAMGNKTTAIAELKVVRQFNPNFKPAADALAQLQNGTFVAPIPGG